MARHSPVSETGTQNTLPDDVLGRRSNAGRATPDAREAEKLPSTQPKASSIYSPLALGCIRVLRLQSAPRLEDPLVGTLDTVHHNDGTQYEALSYTWGDTFVNDQRSTSWIKSDNDRLRYNRVLSTQPSELGEIILCGSALSIAANLYAALKRLRFSGSVRNLWIDALCINQDNPDERSVQVARIAQVFAHASQTIVWLGEDSVYLEGEHVFASCREYEQKMSSRWRSTWRRAVEHGSMKIYTSLSRNHPMGKFFWDIWSKRPLLPWKANEQIRQFGLFGARRYFSRLWCVQEVASADNVIVKCGDSEIPWSPYTDYVHEHNILDMCGVGKLPAITGNPEHTFDKLIECSGLQCSDERDYIYAITSLLRLCKDCPPIQIDYNLDWPTVFTAFARDYVMFNGYTAAWSTLILALGRGKAEEATRLPSWVPDWRPISFEFEGFRFIETYPAKRIRNDAAACERKCRDAGRNIAVAFDDYSMKIDLWYCGQVCEEAESTLLSGHDDEKLERNFKSSDYLYSLPPEYGSYSDPCLILRSCAEGKSVFRAIAVVGRSHPSEYPPWLSPRTWDVLDAGPSFQEAMHRISII